jgi:hypothetical protein
MLLARTGKEAGGMDASKWLGLAALVLGVLGSYWSGKVISSWLTGETLTLTKEAAKHASRANLLGWLCIGAAFVCGGLSTLLA